MFTVGQRVQLTAKGRHQFENVPRRELVNVSGAD